MSDGVYKVIELVGTSTESWEEAARNAVDRACKSLNDLRVAEVGDLLNINTYNQPGVELGKQILIKKLKLIK